jgi:NADH-quinone oxidoreductase E subunit
MSLEFSASAKQRIERLLTQYPTAQAALLPVLHLAQEEFGHLPDEALHLVADTLKVPAAHVFGVITFYTMFHREKSGRNELMVCTNVSCMLRGGYEILHHIEKRLGIKAGESTPDGAFHLVEEECLAACANAPMMICGNDYFLDLTPQKVDTILEDLRKRWREQQKMAPGSGTLHGVGPLPGSKDYPKA